MPPQDPDNAKWFADEVLPHEPQLRSYLRNKFPSHPDIDDLIQETYARLLETRWKGSVRLPKAFIFTTARNAACDYFRRRKIVAFEAVAEVDDLGVLDDGPGVVETVGRDQELELLTQAIQSLPDRCRQVLTLRKIYGLPQKEIAAQLGISEHTVEVQVANGMRRCADFLARHGLP